MDIMFLQQHVNGLPRLQPLQDLQNACMLCRALYAFAQQPEAWVLHAADNSLLPCGCLLCLNHARRLCWYTQRLFACVALAHSLVLLLCSQ